jgi:hypothetical protein
MLYSKRFLDLLQEKDSSLNLIDVLLKKGVSFKECIVLLAKMYEIEPEYIELDDSKYSFIDKITYLLNEHSFSFSDDEVMALVKQFDDLNKEKQKCCK